MRHRDLASLLDIAKACDSIMEFGSGLDDSSFLSDRKTQSAVIHQLMLVGEAVKRLSDEFREAHSQMPWMAMAGMRDRLIHQYDNVDMGEVWRTASREVPRLIGYIRPLIDEQGAG